MDTQIEELLTRGVDKIYPTKEALAALLQSGKKLKLYQGFDPTGTELHIGHMVGLRKLSQWQKLGHHVIFLIGTGTGQAGDPTGKLSSREKFFDEEELKHNAKDYVMQAKKLLDFEGENAVEIVHNGDWLNKLNLADILSIAGNLTVQQLVERDMFQERIKNHTDINMREFLYPILQGYDSVAMDVDLELGGSDQTFNMLIGRKLQRAINNREKFVMTTPLLADASGKKIGKSEGNVISITATPNDLYGSIMSLSDDVIVKGLEYLTDIPITEVKEIEKKISDGQNPIEFKKLLAFEIVKQLNDESAATSASQAFQNTVQNKELPENIASISVNVPISLSAIALEQKLIDSNSEWKRMVEQGGVSFNDEKITNPSEPFTQDGILKIGKRSLLRITKSN